MRGWQDVFKIFIGNGSICGTWNKVIRQAAALLIVSVCLSGCSRSVPSLSDFEEPDNVYEMPEMMLIVATERNRYEQIYTDEIWAVEINHDGKTFKEHLLEQVRFFLEKLRTLNLLAAEQEIVLSEQEKEALRRLSSDFYESLTAEDRTYMKASEEDIFMMYQEYHLANKVVEVLTQDINLEISDSEAKVMTVMELTVGEKTAADEAYGRLQEEGADFAAVANQYSESEAIRLQVGRGERDSAYEEVVFGLATDEISPVFQAEGRYYIVKCLNEYDEDATQARKEILSVQRQSDAFAQIYSRFAIEQQVVFEQNLFDGLVFSPGDQTTTTGFFTMYQEYMMN